MKSLAITGLKSCVTVLQAVMRTNVLVLLCFIAGITPIVSNCGELAQIVDKTPFFSLVSVYFWGILTRPAK